VSQQQTRRSISISGGTYNRLKAYAQTNQKSMSSIVEDLLKSLLGSMDRKAKIQDAVESKKGGPPQSSHFSF
jgi:hypothetical protein